MIPIILKAVNDLELYDNIPQELKALNQWVVYGVDSSKLKMPFNPTTMQPAKAGDPSTWSDYIAAYQIVRSGLAQGVGFEFNDSGIYGVDLDHVLHDGQLTPEAQEVVALLDSYTEISPSGDGLHIFVKAVGVELEAHRKGFIEIYCKERYFTMTGQVYGELKPIQERTEQLRAVYDKYLKPVPVEPPKQPITTDYSSAIGFKTDEDYLRIGLEKDAKLIELWNGDRPHGNESADDQGLMNKLAYWCNKNEALMESAFLSSPHYAQKDAEHIKKCDRQDYIPRTVQEAITGTSSTAREADTAYRPTPGTQQITKAAEVAANNTPNIHAPSVVKASDVPYEPPRWLIAPYFQRGKGTLIQADNGTGKTAFICAIAAHVSTGRPLLEIPIETPGDVLILSVEDDLPVLRGRIEASGGDLDKCHFMTNAAGLTFNSPEVEQAVKQIGAKMVVFDPFQAFLGASVNMDKSNQTRPELAKLFEMGDRNDCAIAIIAHIGKGSFISSAVNRSLGSVDIPAAMRSVFQLTRNPEDENECIAVHIKCSNAPKGRSISFTIGARGGVQWNGFSDMTAEDLNTMVKRQEKGIPYENEPLVQVFNQLVADKPGGGFWPYEKLKAVGMKILGFPPFSSTADLKAKLDSALTRELQTRAGLIVTCGHKQNGQRGVRIEQYECPAGYQISIVHSDRDS